jgi:Putative DNA-binding domain
MTGVAINRVTRVPGRLLRFQDEFARALLAEDSTAAGFDPEIARLAAQPAFAVYRNTVMKGCIDALQANYPSIARLVGDEWFRAAAAIYARANLPRHPTLADYGADFADFLAAFAPAAELSYLPGVARLDRFWTEAHTARDEAPLDAAAVARLAPEALARTVLRPHASARWAWFDAPPIVTIWRRNRYPEEADDRELEWRGEGVLIVRPGGAVEHVELDAGTCSFLDSCAARRTLAGAAAAALAVSAETDLVRLMAQLLQAGAFGHMYVSDRQPQELE